MANQSYVNLLSQGGGVPQAAGSAFNTFTSYQDISPTPLATIYGLQLQVGQKLELEAEGEFSTTGTPTLQIGFIYGATAGAAGGTAFAQSAAITTGSGAAAWPWHLRVQCIITAVGSSGSMIAQGILDLGTSLTAVSANVAPTTQAARTVTINTTTNNLLGVGAAWGTSSASNSIKVNNFSALLLN